MSSELINKILEEIGLEPIDSESMDQQNEDLWVKQPAPTPEQKG